VVPRDKMSGITNVPMVLSEEGMISFRKCGYVRIKIFENEI
jgi:hypothetical protein